MRAAATAAAVALAGASIAVHGTIHRAADAQHFAARPVGSSGIAEAIEGFGPMANYARVQLFEDFANRWPRLRADRDDGARGLLAWVDAEAEAAFAAEPESWLVQQSVARLYRVVAATEPGHRERARRHLERTRALGPRRAVFPPALGEPAPGSVERGADGRTRLVWRRAEGAAYYVIAERVNGGPRRRLGWVYGAATESFTVPPGDAGAAAGAVYLIKACAPERCGPWFAWPPGGGAKPGDRRPGALGGQPRRHPDRGPVPACRPGMGGTVRWRGAGSRKQEEGSGLACRTGGDESIGQPLLADAGLGAARRLGMAARVNRPRIPLKDYEIYRKEYAHTM